MLLFKCYIHELSIRLNNISGINSPLLNRLNVTHLLWADDLMTLALDKESLQIMIDEPHSFSEECGLQVAAGQLRPPGPHNRQGTVGE